MDDNDDEKRKIFLRWLLDSGAKFPKIQWPSLETESGIRGAVATSMIATDEHMVEIPMHLMISPPIIFRDPEIGTILYEMRDVLYGDLILCVYMMHEMCKGKDSFYHPFLDILPEPGNVSEWLDSELSLLQDDNMYLRAKRRRLNIKSMYEQSIGMLQQLYPDKFPTNDYYFTRFKFCYNSVQARAFGRRLPWTALVPFADCLNHNNVQTKYDYNIEGNGVFRLFPSGGNKYLAGTEVFNSYGRRPNENLLMDYGFALLDNEWDEVEVLFELPTDDVYYNLRIEVLSAVGSQPNPIFKIRPKEIPLQILTYLRIAMMDAFLLQQLLDIIYQKISLTTNRNPTNSKPNNNTTASHNNNITTATTNPNPTSNTSTTTISTTLLFNIPSVIAPPSPPPEQLARNILPKSIRSEAMYYFERIYSSEFEIQVLSRLQDILSATLLGSSNSSNATTTTIDEDEEALEVLDNIRKQCDDVSACSHSSNIDDATEHTTSVMQRTEHTTRVAVTGYRQCPSLLTEQQHYNTIVYDSNEYWKITNALHYRLTKKRILDSCIKIVLDPLISYFNTATTTAKLDSSSVGKDTVSSIEDRYSLLTTYFPTTSNSTNAPTITSSGTRRPFNKGYPRQLDAYLRDAAYPEGWLQHSLE